LNIPSNGYQNITISYDIQRSSAGNGALTNTFYYSTDGGSTWKNSVTNAGADTKDTIQTSPNWNFKTITITDPAANNNSNLKFKILFTGGQNTGTSGNNRIDNITVEGTTFVATEISNQSDVDNLILFPNPNNTGVVNFSKSVDAKLFSIDGRLVKSVTQSTSMNISDVAKGIYLIQIGNSTQQLIVQ
jgi:Secretion system C-terminal sorting domain